jgi:replication factor C subunit 1
VSAEADAINRTHLGQAAPAPKGKDAPKKAVLISGPPGIGKTSAAKIVCKALGFDVMEVNASDTRGKVWR